MNLNDVIEEIGAQVGAIAGLRMFDFPPDNLHPPSAWIGYPEDYTFDKTYGRGSDSINSLPLIVAVARVSDRAGRELVGAYVNGSGATSIKAVVEARNNGANGGWAAFDDVQVTGVTFDILTRGGTDYLAALFLLNITGPGST
ncbi:hypothetical protein [Phytohabitans rumicis]|uniref:Uncharacterized protein n=1 Tax=Phytohabitans rumicis TaxID=1076125 RepID=A0A6V8L9V8_9ACTN|nr:hypothetical protein [Phytohabitans rumicis]GFJ91581.1 hypothetical protein Prum_052230 [Phytohabitans rumicis]